MGKNLQHFFEFLPGFRLVKAFRVFFDHSFKELAHLAEHLKPRDNNEEHETGDGVPSFDLVPDKKFSEERKEGEGGKCICEQLFHQSDKL